MAQLWARARSNACRAAANSSAFTRRPDTDSLVGLVLLHEPFSSYRSDRGMARLPAEKTASRPLAIAGRAHAETDATPRFARAPARNRSDRSLVKNRRRLYRRTLSPGRVARGRALCARAPTRIALRARTNLQVRNPAQIKTTLRRQNHPRHPFPRRLTYGADPCGSALQ